MQTLHVGQPAAAFCRICKDHDVDLHEHESCLPSMGRVRLDVPVVGRTGCMNALVSSPGPLIWFCLQYGHKLSRAYILESVLNP
jgi:hypothetical protein